MSQDNSAIALARVGSVAKGPDGEDILMPDIEEMKRAKELRDLAPESNVQQLVVASLSIGIDFFKIVMASMLSVFVPQSCPDDLTGETICFNNVGLMPSNAELSSKYNTTTHDCTFEENFQDLTSFNKFVIGWNFITLIVMIIHYIFTWRRERFMIEKLDISITDSAIHLKDVLHQYPHIESRLLWYNKHVFGISVFGMICQMINIIVSGVLIFRDYYNGYKSGTSFVTSVLITAGVMKTAAESTWKGIQHSMALSCITFEPIIYNTIDAKFKQPSPN